MKIKSTNIIFLTLGLSFLIAIPVFAEDINNPFMMPGRTQGTGNFFEITDSRYLNVTLESSEEINVFLESIPKIISLNIGAAENSFEPVSLSLRGLEPNKTYYKYQNSHKNEAVFISDENGNFTWSQDLSQPFHIWIQEQKSTTYIDQDTTLDSDIIGSVEISTSGVSLDCNGHNITGDNSAYGIYIYNKTNTTVKNCNVSNFSYGIYLGGSGSLYNTITDNDVFTNEYGLFVQSSSWSPQSSNNYVFNNQIYSNIYQGMELYGSNTNQLIGNSISNNGGIGLLLNWAPSNYLRNNIITNNDYNFGVYGGWVNAPEDIDTSNTVNGKPIYYLVNEEDKTIDASLNPGYVGVINSKNITIKDITISNNVQGIYLENTTHSRIENTHLINNLMGVEMNRCSENEIIDNELSNNIWNGIRLWVSSNSIFRDNDISSNGTGIELTGPSGEYSHDNKIYHNNFKDNQGHVVANMSENDLFNEIYPTGGNYWSGYAGVDEKSGENQDQPGSDGIGDTPYTFYYMSQDRYPFMEESGWGIISPALNYAPHLWFDSEEKFFPTTPFFYTDDINEISGEKGKNEYIDLNADQQKDSFTVFHHLVDLGDEFVHEYWLYYAYNDFTNQHYHDWEKVFIFVDKNNGEVNKVAASAHARWQPNNILNNPGKEHSRILVEGGSHASYVDGDEDGLGGSLLSGLIEKRDDLTNFLTAWGIFNWSEEDALNGQKFFATDLHYKVEEITSEFIAKFNGFETFQKSPPLGFPVSKPVFDGKIYIPIGGESPKHPWYQVEYDDPLKIIDPLTNVIDGATKLINTFEGIPNSIIAIFSDEIFYTFTDEDGNFLLNNVPVGSHEIIVNAEGFAPYIQRFTHEENQTLGVDGSLFLVPEQEAFQLQGIIRDSSRVVIENATVNIFDESGNKLFTTITNAQGEYILTLSAQRTYIAEINHNGIIGFEEISGEPGDIVTADVTIGKRNIVIQVKNLLEELIDKVKEFNIQQGIKFFLTAELFVAKGSIEKSLHFIDFGRERLANSMLLVVDKSLSIFIKQVKFWAGRRISEDSASILIEKAEKIKELIQLAIQTPM